MKVRREEGDNRFCGPAALSLLTGRKVPTITAALRDITGDRAIKGVHNWAMRKALTLFGRNVEVVFTKYQTTRMRPTLVGAIRMLKTRKPNEKFLITLSTHYVVLKGRKLYDNVHPTGVFLRQYPYRRSRVERIDKVFEA